MSPEGHLKLGRLKENKTRFVLHQMARIKQATPYLVISKSINSSQKKKHSVVIPRNYLLM